MPHAVRLILALLLFVPSMAAMAAPVPNQSDPRYIGGASIGVVCDGRNLGDRWEMPHPGTETQMYIFEVIPGGPDGPGNTYLEAGWNFRNNCPNLPPEGGYRPSIYGVQLCIPGFAWDADIQRCMAVVEDCPINGNKRRLHMPESQAASTFCDGQCRWHKIGQEAIGIGLGPEPEIWRAYFYEAREYCESQGPGDGELPPGYPGQPFEDSDGDGIDDTAPKDRFCGIAFGLKVCDKSSQGQPGGSSCGEVNGQTICPDKMPTGGCVSAGDAVVCDNNAGSPPAPDNGTPGQPASPDGQLQGTGPDGEPLPPLDVFGPGTIDGSAGGTQTTDGSDATPDDDGSGGDDGDGDCEGADCEDGGGEYSGGATCQTAPLCSGDAVTCGVVHQAWLSRCEAEAARQMPTESELLAETGLSGYTEVSVLPNEHRDILEIFDDSGFIGSRSCPEDLRVDYFLGDLTFPISQLCSLFQLLGTLVLIGAYIVAARIVAGGF